MSLPDPLPVATDPATTFAKIVSPDARTSVFRKEFEDGAALKITLQQNGNTTRSRHVARLDWSSAPDAISGVRRSMATTLTIDEPANGSISDTSILYFVNVLKDTLTDAIVGKMLNGEI